MFFLGITLWETKPRSSRRFGSCWRRKDTRTPKKEAAGFSWSPLAQKALLQPTQSHRRNPKSQSLKTTQAAVSSLPSFPPLQSSSLVSYAEGVALGLQSIMNEMLQRTPHNREKTVKEARRKVDNRMLASLWRRAERSILCGALEEEQYCHVHWIVIDLDLTCALTKLVEEWF